MHLHAHTRTHVCARAHTDLLTYLSLTAHALQISQDYQVPYRNLPTEDTYGKPELKDTRVDVDSEIAAHLSACYGDNVDRVLSIAQENNLGKRLVPNHPVLEAEVMYTCRVSGGTQAI